MRQLRPHLASQAEFLVRWQRQQEAGYRILGLWRDEQITALAGFRLTENLVHGFHLYVDDLVTAEESRRHGDGSRLMIRLQEEARAAGCAKVVLDTGLANTLAQRFYYRNGLLLTALRFSLNLARDDSKLTGCSAIISAENA